MSGDYRKMVSDADALRLATTSALVDEGLSTFQQILLRAESLKSARCSIYPALESIGVEYGEQWLECDEIVAIVRQFYGEMTPEELERLCSQHEPIRAALEQAIEDEDKQYKRNLDRERQKRQRQRQAAQMSVGVA